MKYSFFILLDNEITKLSSTPVQASLYLWFYPEFLQVVLLHGCYLDAILRIGRSEEKEEEEYVD